MTQAQPIGQDIRRSPDSAVDVEFYRVRAAAALPVVFLVAAAPIR
jgi:hypothetical protein